MSVLASADVEDLSAAGLISAPSSNGTRRVHKRRLNRSSDEENSHVPLTPFSSTSSSSVTEMYATQALLIIGTIAKKPNRVYNDMDTFAQINETCVLKTKDGRNGLQYVFHGNEGQEFLEELAPGSVTVHPVSGMEFTQWQREHDFHDFDE